MTRLSAKFGTAIGLGLMLIPFTQGIAAELEHETQFSIRYGAVEIGRAEFNIRVDQDTYELRGNGRTTGLVDWLASSTGSVESVGSVIENQLKPSSHSAAVHEKKKKPESVILSFVGEKVVDVDIKSNKKRKVRKAPKYVPVEAKHLASVLDPASALIVPVPNEKSGDGRRVCDQKFPVFDGETRYDIKLRYKSVRSVKTKGYNGKAYVCQMRYVPVAGHKKNHKQVKEMAANKRMEIWLAPMQGQSVFTPIQIVVGTKYGSFLAKPTYFGKPG